MIQRRIAAKLRGTTPFERPTSRRAQEAPMTYETILYEVEGGKARITLNREE